MTPALLHANARRMPVASDTVSMCVTSPPYWSLRQYSGTQSLVWGGVEGCAHEWGYQGLKYEPNTDGSKTRWQHVGGREGMPEGGSKTQVAQGAFCLRCGAWYGELGLEPRPELYIEHMVEIFREVRRVLHPSGTVWVNMGDSYAQSTLRHRGGVKEDWKYKYIDNKRSTVVSGLKPKDLVGIPWMLAFALRADGWWLRSDIIWSKPNPMPESVTDRPTKAHEYVFLLTKSKKYYYDADAVREANLPQTYERYRHKESLGLPKVWVEDDGKGIPISGGKNKNFNLNPAGRNRRTVWHIATAPYSGAHFATFPPALVEPCIKAGSSEHGVCPRCRNPWRRVVEVEYKRHRKAINRTKPREHSSYIANRGEVLNKHTTTLGWQPTCSHDQPPVPALILDPFVGSGTTCMVARKLGRNSVGLDLSYPYLQLAKERLGLTALEQWEQGKDGKTSLAGLPMFEERRE